MTFLIDRKIKLAKFTKDHITDEYISWLNDHEVTKYLNVGRLPVDRSNITVPDGINNIRFAIISKKIVDKKFVDGSGYTDYVGTISMDICWLARKAKVGYMIGDSNYWGAGIGSSAVSLVVDYSFNRLNLNKLTAGVVSGNVASAKILENNGFKKYAVEVQDYWLDGMFLDVDKFHIFKA